MKKFILLVLAWLPFQISIGIVSDYHAENWQWWVLVVGATISHGLVNLVEEK